MQYFSRLVLLFSVLVCSLDPVFAVQITADASGSQNPSTSPDQAAVVQNGDFEIFRTNPLPIGNDGFLMGDGINDFTRWVFDFTQDPNYPLFDNTQQLTKAELFIQVTPMDVDFSSDFVRIQSLANIPINPLTPNFTVGSSLGITIDLLNWYSSSEILGRLQNGKLAMRYEDDAIVTHAILNLATAIPEPMTLTLLSLSGLGLALRKKLKHRGC